MTKALIEECAKAIAKELRATETVMTARSILKMTQAVLRIVERHAKNKDTEPKRVSYLRVNGERTGYGGRGWRCVRTAEKKGGRKR